MKVVELLFARQSGSEFVSFIARIFASFGPDGRWLYSASQVILFYILLVLAYRSSSTSKSIGAERSLLNNILQSDGLFAFLLFILVFVSRLPAALYGYLNPDESLWVGCAKTIFVEPRLWLSCDTSTSGPLVLVPLLLLKLLFLPIDFGTTRIAAGVILGITTMFMYFSYVRLFERPIARLVIVFYVVATGIAMSTFWDFLVYNGEYVAILLLSISLYYLSVIYTSDREEKRKIILLAIVLGMIPFAKLQAVPLALLLTGAAYALLIARYRFRFLILFSCMGLVPLAGFLAVIAAGGGLDHFWNSYILYNIVYGTNATPEGATLFTKLAFAWDLLFVFSDVVFYFNASCIVIFLSFLFSRYGRIGKKEAAIISVVIFGLLFFVVSLYCIGQPYRLFTHYTQFAFFSVNILVGSSLTMFVRTHARPEDSRPGLPLIAVFAIMLVTSTAYFHLIFRFYPGYYGDAEIRKNGYSHIPEVVEVLNANSNPGDRIAIWGLSGSFYSDTDLIMGTRYADTSGVLVPVSFSDYFLETFIEDLDRNKPKIFLDAISPRAQRFDNRYQYGMQHYPSVAEYVAKHYNFVKEVAGHRVYVRNR